MQDPRPFRPWPDAAIAAAAVALALAPLARMGWLGDDWLHLWRTLAPETAPPVPGGLLPAPAVPLLWTAAARLAGDAPWGMHALMALSWLVLAAGVVRWHRGFGGGAAGAAVAALALVLHGALAEPRLWAAAAAGVPAAALGLWGAWRLHAGPGAGGRGLGAILVLAALLLRADALLLLVLPAVAGLREDRPTGRRLLALAAAGAAVLAVAAGRVGWELRPADGGHALRLLLAPWGPPLPAALAAAGGAAGALLALGGGRLLVAAAPRPAAFLLVAGAAAVALSCLPGPVLGRHVLVAAVPLGLALGAWWDGSGRPNLPGPARRAVRMAVLAWLAVSLVGAYRGGAARDLRGTSALETALYRAVRAELPLPGHRLTILNPPPRIEETGTAGLEAAVGAASRRPVAVVVGGDASRQAVFPVAVWRHGQWLLWTGREIRHTPAESE